MERETRSSELSKNSDAQDFVAPRNPTEECVAGIWQALLEVDRVGATDNFLLLGGESLAAAQAVSRVRETFGCEITIRSVLVGTVEDVAAEIAKQGSGQS
jgi:acyl carrier protein